MRLTSVAMMSPSIRSTPKRLPLPPVRKFLLNDAGRPNCRHKKQTKRAENQRTAAFLRLKMSKHGSQDHFANEVEKNADRIPRNNA